MEDQPKPTQQPIQESEPISSTPILQGASEVISSNETSTFTWQASEYVEHDKSSTWYLGLIAGVVILCAILGFLHQWLSIVVVVVMGAAVVVYSRKEPRVLQYALDNDGISIDGKVAPYSHYKAYSVHPQLGWREIDFEPSQRFAPRLTVLCEEENFDQIEAILLQHLPRVDREQDVIEKLSRYLKF